MTTADRTVHVWADIRCPWCWMGHRRLSAAHLEVGGPPIERRAFLLEPDGPTRKGISVYEAATTEWGMTVEQWEASRDRIEAASHVEGLKIRGGTARIFDSRDAHRVLKLAAASGCNPVAAWDVAFDAHFRRNLDMGDHAVLTALGTEMGLDEHDTSRMLDSARFIDDVRSDHEEAQCRGIGGAPTVVSDTTVLSGHRDVTELVRLLTNAAEAVR